MDISFLQLAIIVATIAIVLGAGIWSSRSVRSAEGYSLGGRSAGVSLVAGSIAGTCVGGGATVGTSQLAASIGLSAWWFSIGSGVALIIMGLFYASPLRRTSLETISQYLLLNYGKPAGTFSSVVSSLGILFSAVASTLPGIGILVALLGVPSWVAAIILMIMVAGYTFFGGMKSAGVGGILKMAIIWVSLLISGGYAVYSLHSDPVAMSAIPDGWFSIFGISTSSILVNLFSLIVGMLCTQSYIQAIFSASNPRTASVGAFAAALIAIPVGLPCAYIGMYMQAVHPEVPALLVLPTYLMNYQPVLLGSIAMGGIVLSLIGSIGGLSLGIATMLSRDIVCRAFKITSVNKQLLIARLLLLVVIACSAIIAIANADSQILFWNYLSMALRGGGIFLPLTIAVFSPHAIEPHWAVASMFLSTGSAIAAAIIGSPIHPLFIGLTVSLLLLIPGWISNNNHHTDEPIPVEE